MQILFVCRMRSRIGGDTSPTAPWWNVAMEWTVGWGRRWVRRSLFFASHWIGCGYIHTTIYIYIYIYARTGQWGISDMRIGPPGPCSHRFCPNTLELRCSLAADLVGFDGHHPKIGRTARALEHRRYWHFERSAVETRTGW